MEELLVKAYKRSSLYYYAVFATAVVFAAIGYFLNIKTPELFHFSNQTVTITSTIAYLYLVASIPFALWFFNKKLTVVAAITDLTDRFKSYINLHKTRIFLVGFNFVGNIILLYVLHNKSFLYAAAIGAVAMLFCKPNKISIEKEFNPPILNED